MIFTTFTVIHKLSNPHLSKHYHSKVWLYCATKALKRFKQLHTASINKAAEISATNLFFLWHRSQYSNCWRAVELDTSSIPPPPNLAHILPKIRNDSMTKVACRMKGFHAPINRFIAYPWIVLQLMCCSHVDWPNTKWLCTINLANRYTALFSHWMTINLLTDWRGKTANRMVITPAQNHMSRNNLSHYGV